MQSRKRSYPPVTLSVAMSRAKYWLGKAEELSRKSSKAEEISEDEDSEA
jgi:hypothetical protein